LRMRIEDYLFRYSQLLPLAVTAKQIRFSYMKKTPLYEAHLKYHGKMVPFHNYLMPLQYESIIKEHHLVRNNAGIFDISHMAKFEITGENPFPFIQQIITNDASPMAKNQVLYSPICNEKGGIIDDVLVYKRDMNHFLLVANCANTEKDILWLKKNAGYYPSLEINNITDHTAIIALQGPSSLQMLEHALKMNFAHVKRFFFEDFDWDGIQIMISRTGYTGEDGFELFIDAGHAIRLWELLLEKNEHCGLKPAGLGARDTLRLEACLLLYGNDMDETTTPLGTPIAWAVKFNKRSFIGKAHLLELQNKGIEEKLAGFEMTDRGIPRQSYSVVTDNEVIGKVTSGTFSPTINKGIGLARLKKRYAENGQRIQVCIRGKNYNARIVNIPFYKRGL